jgi:hypothetical protein
MPVRKDTPDHARLDKVVADARRAREERDKSYRGQALRMYPWICGRCAREFDHGNVHELTVHHKDHDHDNNPPDGSNWELLCVYCHDNEHQKQLEAAGGADTAGSHKGATHNPFADLKARLERGK